MERGGRGVGRQSATRHSHATTRKRNHECVGDTRVVAVSETRERSHTGAVALHALHSRLNLASIAPPKCMRHRCAKSARQPGTRSEPRTASRKA